MTTRCGCADTTAALATTPTPAVRLDPALLVTADRRPGPCLAWLLVGLLVGLLLRR